MAFRSGGAGCSGGGGGLMPAVFTYRFKVELRLPAVVLLRDGLERCLKALGVLREYYCGAVPWSRSGPPRRFRAASGQSCQAREVFRHGTQHHRESRGLRELFLHVLGRRQVHLARG